MNNYQKALYDLQDLQNSIAAQRTAELERLEKEYDAKKKELRDHLTQYMTSRGKHETICAGPDCDVLAVAKYSTSFDKNGLIALALGAGVSQAEIDALTTKKPTWAIG